MSSDTKSGQINGMDKPPASPKDASHGQVGQQKLVPTKQSTAPASKLTGQAAKEAKKAEKAAKRAKSKEVTDVNGVPDSQASARGAGPKDATKANLNKGEKPAGKGIVVPINADKQARDREGSASKAAKLHQAPNASATKPTEVSHPVKPTVIVVERDPIAAYLQSLSKPKGLQAATTDVHPAVISVGLKMASLEICGSAARCAALLIAFKAVIRSYRTPPANSLNRHLVQHLSPQIDFIRSCRPLTINMGNAIRWLKFEIATNTDISLDDETARAELIEKIDRFLASKVTLAGRVIAEFAADRIRDGDVIMTYARSSVVEQALCYAFSEQRKRFKVIVVDDEPLAQGRQLAGTLTRLGVPTTYCPYYSLHAPANAEVTKVFLGANGMMSNGALLSRSGTTAVARYGRSLSKSVFVLCETLKFSDRAPVDSLVLNELLPQRSMSGSSSAGEVGGEEYQCAHLMYDLCPAENLDLIITETAEGAIPVEAVPAVYRMMMDYENQGGTGR